MDFMDLWTLCLYGLYDFTDLIMEQFTYSDIFDTKGIEYIIVIFFLLLIIPVWRMLSKTVKQKGYVGDALQALTINSLRIPQGLLFSRNHTWSFLEKSGVASVGMDDLLLHLTGGVELKYLKEQQERVRRGEAHRQDKPGREGIGDHFTNFG